MGFKSDLEAEIKAIFRAAWKERDGNVVPDTPDIRLGNEGVNLTATVLYADIDGSTAMVDGLSSQMAAEVYKAYLLCASRIIRSEDGAITAYDGDRVMAVYIGDKKNTRAVRSALRIKAAVKNIINPGLNDQYGDEFELKQVVGIDTSNLLVARTGIRGANDLVWVGPSANWAAKLSSISEQPYSTFISEAIYKNMDEVVKTTNGTDMWEQRSWRGKTVYRSNWLWDLPN